MELAVVGVRDGLVEIVHIQLPHEARVVRVLKVVRQNLGRELLLVEYDDGFSIPTPPTELRVG